MKTLFRYDLVIFFVSIICLLTFSFFGFSQSSLIIFGISIFLFGIPHGALDHIIAFNGKKRSVNSTLFFYAKYLGLIFIVFLSWYVAPILSFIAFLLISAHHFGQSQLFYIKLSNFFAKHSFYLAWGSFVLSVIIWLNYAECLAIFQSLEWLNVTQWMTSAMWQWSTIISGIWLSGLFIYSSINKLITSKRLTFEISLLAILIAFATFTNAVIAFSIYFGLWHSLRSLILEYESIKEAWTKYSFKQFINDLLPFTLLAFVFLAFSFYFFSNFEMNLSPYMVFIIIISTLTVPHLFVMSDLYENHTA